MAVAASGVARARKPRAQWPVPSQGRWTMDPTGADSTFLSLCQRCGSSDNLGFWQTLLQGLAATDGGLRRNEADPQDPGMETGAAVIEQLDQAPPRTLDNAPVASSSPLPYAVREMLETR